MTVYPIPQEETVFVAPPSTVPPVCANCKHWDVSDIDALLGQWGMCRAISELIDNKSEEPPMTRGDFGCILFEPKE